MHLHRFGQTQFVFKANIKKGVQKLVKGKPSEKGTDALIVNLEQGDRKEETNKTRNKCFQQNIDHSS